jgi:hypothetical protein
MEAPTPYKKTKLGPSAATTAATTITTNLHQFFAPMKRQPPEVQQRDVLAVIGFSHACFI